MLRNYELLTQRFNNIDNTKIMKTWKASNICCVNNRINTKIMVSKIQLNK